ncbi:MAG: YhgE/Pip family protein, partial [Bifidobacterium longum]|nr:YhgE/Pip family protein [Bifidobacterium longum]
MNTMWKLFTGDIKRLTSNVVSIIIVIGLVMIPGLFTWFNVAACWDPFSNMKNLKFAVANVDEGYRSDLIPMKVTVGDQVVNALRANSQLDWTITSKDDAVEGARSGKYYAAIVIPKSFSKDMMTFFSDDVQHAELTYYRNEKKNALAPNLLNEGTEYSALTDTAGALLDTSNSLITQASSAAKQGGKDLASAKQGVTDVVGALGTTADAMSSALDASASSFGAVSDSIDKLYS